MNHLLYLIHFYSDTPILAAFNDMIYDWLTKTAASGLSVELQKY